MSLIESNNGKISCESMGAVLTWVCREVPLTQNSRREIFCENGTPIYLSFDVVDLTSCRETIERLKSLDNQHEALANIISQTMHPEEIDHFVSEVQNNGSQFLIIIGYQSGDNYGDPSGKFTTTLETVFAKMHKSYGAVLIVRSH
jgi:hypothetical protein